ncbi:heterocyst frequency control protein PatD [Leptolyngbya sp. BL0902]|uniref:heterocyst frequency control protein PatD n=1 Tax=Leptolyngbya sp. BL0902 TaxID=1115757 RepID=UPI0018E847FA|nr:heterocyst frequency control protein PatD [Leptolyngbya sp. BL0902]
MSTAVQAFQSHLSTVSDLCQRANPNPRDLQGHFLTVQQLFQQQILPLGTDDAPNGPNLQPVLTEMSRTLRLIAMDVAFLQTARQPHTRHQRQHQMLTKLTQLEAFTTNLQQTLSQGQG